MMKNTLLIAIGLLFITACGSKKADEPTTNIKEVQKVFSLSLKVSDIDNSTAYIERIVDNEYAVIDTVAIESSHLTYTMPIEQAEIIYVKFDGFKKRLKLFAENAEVSVIVASLENINETTEVSNGELNELMTSYYQEKKNFDEELKKLEDEENEAIANNDTEKVKQINTEYDRVYDEMLEFTEDFVKDNSNNVLGPYLTQRHLYPFEADRLAPLINGFSEETQSSVYVTELKKRLTILQNVAVGVPAPNFSQKTPEGKMVSLNTLKGKYLLIDFWASWCPPCRVENPNLVTLYDKYHDKGFDILGVSFDRKQDRWEKAIKDDNLKWTQISDLKGWSNDAGKLYGVRSIPQNVLLDPNGVIIAKNLFGEKLEETIAEVIPQKES